MKGTNTILASLARVEITVEPRDAFPHAVAPAAVAIHAALHRLIERSAPTYAGRLHSAVPKPLAMTVGELRDGRVEVSLGLLDAETVEIVGGVLGRAVTLGTPIELDHVPSLVTALRGRPVGDLPHALKYRELVERSEPVETVRLDFVTPATMRNAGRSFCSIAPRHVFGGGLVQRWRAFAGPDSGVDLSDETLAAIVLRDGRMAERHVSLGRFGANAFTGWAEYTAPAGSPAAKSLAVLAAFARFAGVGARTAYGLGAVERRPD